MLTQYSVKWLSFLWKLSYHLHVAHYYPSFAPHSDQLIVVPSKRSFKKFLVLASLAIYCIYPPFILYQMYTYIHYNKIPESLQTKFLVKEFYMFLAYVLPLLNQIVRLKNWNDIPEFENELLKFFQIHRIYKDMANKLQATKFCMGVKKSTRRLPVVRKEAKPKSTVVVWKFIGWILLNGLIIAITNTILIIKKPTIPHFFTSICVALRGCHSLIQKLLTTYHIWKWFYFYVRRFNFKSSN